MTPEDLVVIEQIKQLKARYCRLMDTKQWEAWGELFTTDATFSVIRQPSSKPFDEPPAPVAVGRAAVRDFSERIVHTAVTVHHCHNPEIEILGPTTARGTWAMEDIVEGPQLNVSGQGYYHETYRIEDGAWRIASTLVTRLRVIVPTAADKTG